MRVPVLTGGDDKMVDLVTFAGVAPDQRGQ